MSGITTAAHVTARRNLVFQHTQTTASVEPRPKFQDWTSLLAPAINYCTPGHDGFNIAKAKTLWGKFAAKHVYLQSSIIVNNIRQCAGVLAETNHFEEALGVLDHLSTIFPDFKTAPQAMMLAKTFADTGDPGSRSRNMAAAVSFWKYAMAHSNQKARVFSTLCTASDELCYVDQRHRDIDSATKIWGFVFSLDEITWIAIRNTVGKNANQTAENKLMSREAFFLQLINMAQVFCVNDEHKNMDITGGLKICRFLASIGSIDKYRLLSFMLDTAEKLTGGLGHKGYVNFPASCQIWQAAKELDLPMRDGWIQDSIRNTCSRLTFTGFRDAASQAKTIMDALYQSLFPE